VATPSREASGTQYNSPKKMRVSKPLAVFPSWAETFAEEACLTMDCTQGCV
jgi:hypothetical protein